MSSLTDSGRIFNYHRAMIKHYGLNDSHALGWRDAESQLIRFKILGEVADLNDCSVLDAGCGYGDLFPYLNSLYPNLGHYIGIEQIPELLEEAVNRHQAQNTTFISGNFITSPLPKADYVLASGSLNYLSDDPDFIFKAIDKLFDSCKKAVAFNLLKQVSAPGLLVAYNVNTIINHCQTLSTKVVLKENYAEEDFTVYVFRDK